MYSFISFLFAIVNAIVSALFLSTQEKNEREADKIREKLGVPNESAKPDEEHKFPIDKYGQYAGFDGNFNNCVGSGSR